MSLPRIKQPSDLWERSEGKLMVYIMEGISLVTKHGTGNPFVKLSLDKQKQKTQICKHAEDASWRELFLFDVTDTMSELVLEVWTKSGLSKTLIGSCHVCIPTELQAEELIDRVVDLELPANLKTKHKELLDSRMGNVHLRLVYSREHEIPLRPIPNACSTFYYRNHYRNMQTGDLILYSGVGSTDSISKLISGTRYSRVGMVVRMPNKWTGKEKLYIFEVTRNLGKELDAFKESATPGAMLFRLFEHLHAVSATYIWWVPLKMPLEAASCANMVDWVKEAVLRRTNIEFPAIPAESAEFFERYECSITKHHPLACAEICSASAIVLALRLGGKRFPFEQKFLSCVQLMSQDCFGDPIILRERSQEPMPKFQLFTPEPLSRTGSHAVRRSTIHVHSGSNGSSSSLAFTSGVSSAIPPTMSSSDSISSNGMSPAPSSQYLPSGNTIVAPQIRPTSVVMEPVRATPSVANLRQDASTTPPPSFSSQHIYMAPESAAVVSSSSSPSGPFAIQPDDSALPTPSSSSSHALQVTEIPSNHVRSASKGESGEITGYRLPSNGLAVMPLAPPAPSTDSLPVFPEASELQPIGPVPANVEPAAQAETITPPTEAIVPGTLNEFLVATISPPAYDTATLGRTTTVDTASEMPPEPYQTPVKVQPIEANEPAAPAATASQSHRETPPPATAPKPKPKLMKFERSASKDEKARTMTAKPGTLANLDPSTLPDEGANARNRAVSNGAKPRLLPAPSGRNVTMPVSFVTTAQQRAEIEASPPSDAPPSVPQIQLPVEEASGPEEAVSPRRKSKKSPRRHHHSPSNNDDGTASTESSTPPERSRKKKTRKHGDPISPRDEQGLGQGPPPPVPEKKKRKTGSTARVSKRPELAPEDAVRDDLDEPTKTELRKRRAASVRVVPDSEAGSDWSAAVAAAEAHNAKQQADSISAPIPATEQVESPIKHETEDTSTVTVATFATKSAMVLWTFDAMSETELSVAEGEHVTVLGISGEWCLVELNGKKGAVPVSFLSIEN